MPINLENNKRIAKNTIILYFRMLLLLVVSLYTSRVVLDALGAEDYGIYNVIGGVIVMFSFINSSMATSTQRFLTFELGKGDTVQLKRCFSASLNIHIALGLIILVLAETIGLWFVNAKLVIPQERLYAANIVYQCTIVSFILGITQVPYNASLIAHEKMSVYAYISIIEAFSKLGIAFAIKYYGNDRLVFYAILILISQVLILLLYRAYTIRSYKECRFKLFWDKGLYKQLTSFAGWNLFGSIAWIFRGQGLNIILNLFFGPLLNAAKGIADKVMSSVMGFVSNFNVAMNPQITKNYATGDISSMEKLCYRGNKFAFLLLFLITFPAMLNIDYILNVWLVEVPEYTEIFVILILVTSLVDAFLGNSQYITALMATGKIKYYQIVVGCIIIMVLPLSYIVLKLGGSPTSVIWVMMVISAISGLVRIQFCCRQIGFSFSTLVKSVWLPILFTLLLAVPLPLFVRLHFFENENLLGFIINILIAVASILLVSWYITLSKHERKTLSKIMLKKLHHSR